jgi:hypothetical protein
MLAGEMAGGSEEERSRASIVHRHVDPQARKALLALPLEIGGYSIQILCAEVSSGFQRKSTIFRLQGQGQEGVGEDVTYDAIDHERLLDAHLQEQPSGAEHDHGHEQGTRAQGRLFALSGRHTLGSFCALTERLDLFPVAPEREVSRRYRLWALHSAALDLALRQARLSLCQALSIEPLPVRFLVSLRLGEPPSIEPLAKRLAAHPRLTFKLDPTSSWDQELIQALQETEAVESLDFKAFYRGTVVDQPPDPDLYRRVIDAFPNAWIEDPSPDRELAAILAPHSARFSFDAPIHSVADIQALPQRPGMVNIKPSRLGSLTNLLDAYEHCASEGIGNYGGGQFELGPGRGQIQYLAALFHPDGPNDVAPAGFNLPEPPPDLPDSPLAPRPAPIGFRWQEG